MSDKTMDLTREEFDAFQNWVDGGGMLPPPHKMRDQLRRIAAELLRHRSPVSGDLTQRALEFWSDQRHGDEFDIEDIVALATLLRATQAEVWEKAAKLLDVLAADLRKPNPSHSAVRSALGKAGAVSLEDAAAALRALGEEG